MLIIGHRGASGYAPENTIASFKKALELSVDAIELDVHVLPTGEAVVIHDNKVDRTTDGTGYVRDFSFEEIRALDAGNGEQIPTLYEVLDVIDKKVPVHIELKGVGTARVVAGIVDEYRASDWTEGHFFVSSFNHVELAEFHSLQPDIKLGGLITAIPADYAAFAETMGAYSMNPDSEFLTPAFVEDAHRRHLQVIVFTVNDQSEIRRMQDLNVDGIFTNFPDTARAYLTQAPA